MTNSYINVLPNIRYHCIVRYISSKSEYLHINEVVGTLHSSIDKSMGGKSQIMIIIRNTNKFIYTKDCDYLNSKRAKAQTFGSKEIQSLKISCGN